MNVVTAVYVDLLSRERVVTPRNSLVCLSIHYNVSAVL